MANPRKEVMSFIGTGNADPILHEIYHALEKLVASGTSTIIDLGAIPFGPGDERIMDKILGEGEVHAVLNSVGSSQVAETGIAGVWRIDHMDNDGAIQSRFVEITFMPEILQTQKEDAVFGLGQLGERLENRARDRAN